MALVVMFLWRRYSSIFERRVSIIEIISIDKNAIVYCLFRWHGCANKGYFFPRKGKNRLFYVRGYDIHTGYWLLEPLK